MKDIYWKAQSYKYTKKSIDWYWILWGITTLCIFVTYYLLQDIILSGLTIIISVLITTASFKKPPVKKYSVDENGINLNNNKKTILFSDIRSYVIDQQNMKILINTTNKIQPLIQIPFSENQNSQKIDDFLEKKITKDSSLEIPFLELLLTRFLGF